MGDWVELFDGETLTGWWGWSVRSRRAAGESRNEHEWRVAGAVRTSREHEGRFVIEAGTGVLVNGDAGRTTDLLTTLEHGDCELHVEFCVAHRSNSGVYLQGQYEIQILDDWDDSAEELTYKSSGGIYGRRNESTREVYDGGPPLAKAAAKPGEWQTFDVVFRAPRFDQTGAKTEHARFQQVVYNGVVVQKDFECSGPTGGAWNDVDIPRGPLRLQGDHGPIAFRNVRIRPLD